MIDLDKLEQEARDCWNKCDGVWYDDPPLCLWQYPEKAIDLIAEIRRLQEQHKRMLDYFDVEDGEAVDEIGVDPR
jgi:hypothetical protein